MTGSVSENRDQENAVFTTKTMVLMAVKIVFAFEKIVFVSEKIVSVSEKIVSVSVKIVSKPENIFTTTVIMAV